MAETSTKRKRFTVQEKIAALDRIKSGVTQAKVARDLGLNESTVRGWKKEEEKLRDAVKSKETDDGLKHPKGTPLSGPHLQTQAKKFHNQLHGNASTSFAASSGWLDRFKRRHGIRKTAISGEIRSADDEAACSYPAQLQKIIEDGGYTAEQVYNCDETGPCFKMLPNTTLACTNDEQCKQGFKQMKDRVTVLFCVNQTGNHKLKPLCIDKFKSPRCFHHFVPEVRKNLRQQRLDTKALLLLDNCPAHPPADSLISRDGKITVSYLSKNTTSKIQPLDQGIIATFKMNFRKTLILLRPKVFYIGGEAWAAVTQMCILKCWRNITGARPVPANVEVASDSEDDADFEGFTGATIDSWVDGDSSCPTHEYMTDSEIIQSLSSENTDLDTTEDDEDEELEPPPKIVGLQTGLKFLETENIDSITILQLKRIIEIVKKKKRDALKQTTLDSFF
ncbi:hypothetical protein FKM82_018221 [Ascaphus truei]